VGTEHARCSSLQGPRLAVVSSFLSLESLRIACEKDGQLFLSTKEGPHTSIILRLEGLVLSRPPVPGQTGLTEESSRGLETRLYELMKREGIDLWVCPAAVGPAPEGIAKTGGMAMNLPWTYAGMPGLTLPAGKAANGLPLGFQVVAPTMVDEQLLAWAGQWPGYWQQLSTYRLL
jgi:Amidase